MIELKGLSSDVMKNSSDQENYNREFQDLQMQMYDLATLSLTESASSQPPVQAGAPVHSVI